MKGMFLILVLSCLYSPCTQNSQQRVQEVLANLGCKESKRGPTYDYFVESLKEGERGNGIHYSWMDKMRRLGIKQAFFVVHFSYKNGEYRYKVKQVDYLRRYYCYEDEVKGGKLLQQIHKSGLAKELEEAIIARIKQLELPYQPEYVKEGESYHNLLDDELLPIIDFVAYCPSQPRNPTSACS